jgi:type III secretory pathway component EscT
VTFSQGNDYMSMAIALAAGILVAIILFLAGLSLETFRRFSRQNNAPELLEERTVPENYPR